MRGLLLAAHCLFTSDRCWFFSVVEFAGRRLHRATVLLPNGEVEAHLEADPTASFLDASTQLLPAPTGLYVVGSESIQELRLGD